MKKLVIITSAQFGYHVDTYYYCKYLKEKFNITYIGWDHGHKPVFLDGLKVINVDRSGGVLLRVLSMLKVMWVESRDKKTIIFIKYFQFLSILFRLVRMSNPMVLDIRSASIEKNKARRIVTDVILKFELMFFKNITIVSESLAKKLLLENIATILPLGAEAISKNSKVFDTFEMLYVGTLHNRNIDVFIDGLALYYYSSGKNTKNVRFTIVGDGFAGDMEVLQNKIDKHNLHSIVNLVGRVPHNQLATYFSNHNVGVSYVPITEYYDMQPPTKTFEYLMSGMPVIATKTTENSLVVNECNGILIGESASDVSKGVAEMEMLLETYSSDEIRKRSSIYNWKGIISDLGLYLDKVGS